MEGALSALVFALLHSLWQCALLAAAAALTLRAMARASAAARHTVAMLFLILMVLAPVAQIVMYWQADAPLNGALLPALFAPQLAAIGIDTSVLTTIVASMWLAGALLQLSRYAAGLRSIGAMTGEDAPPAWRARVDQLALALNIAGAVAVRVTTNTIVPCVTHTLRPIIWLPASFITGTPPQQLEALLAHELAHIARKDWLWDGVQRVIEALLFFHPAMWWLSRRIRQEREHACDDLAVSVCGDAVALAEALAALEHARRPRLGLAANGGSLLQRITRLLAAPSSNPHWRVPAFLGALTIFGALLLTQVGMGGGQLPDLQVSASTSGELGPGDFRQITANENGVVRVYRLRVDAHGALRETYTVNGQERPIDADVRAWLATVMQQPLISGT